MRETSLAASFGDTLSLSSDAIMAITFCSVSFWKLWFRLVDASHSEISDIV